MSKLCPFCKKKIKDEDICPYCYRTIREKVQNTSYQPNFTFWKEKHNNTDNINRKVSEWFHKPFKLTKGWIIGGLIILVLIYVYNAPPTTTQQLGQEVVQPTPTPINYREKINNDNILIKINEARLANGLPQLKMSESLKDYANARANEINLSSNLTHDTSLKLKDYDNQHSEYAEILFSGARTASEAVNGWLNSPTHRDVILRKDFENTSVATIQYNAKLGSIVVVEFGKVYIPPPAPKRPIQLQPIPRREPPYLCCKEQCYFGSCTTRCEKTWICI